MKRVKVKFTNAFNEYRAGQEATVEGREAADLVWRGVAVILKEVGRPGRPKKARAPENKAVTSGDHNGE